MSGNQNVIRIQQYLKGQLSPEEMYRLEREALDDPLLQDAIEGYSLQQEVSHRRLSLLQRRLADRIAEQARERNAFFFGWQRLSVAATACVLMVLVLVLLWMRHHPDVASPTEKEVPVELGVSNTPLLRAMAHGSTDAQPVAGWETFNTYLNRELTGRSLPDTVSISFRVDEAGKPVGMTISGTDDTVITGELRRLFEHGPHWRGSRAEVRIIAK